MVPGVDDLFGVLQKFPRLDVIETLNAQHREVILHSGIVGIDLMILF